MKLPKLYRPVWIEFWSLRNGLGPNMGVVYDIDTKVKRRCMRVRIPGGWSWQICNFLKIAEWDYFVETDKEILEEHRENAAIRICSKI